MSTHPALVLVTPGFPQDEADTTCIPLLQDFVLGWKEFYPEIGVRIISVHYPYFKKHYYWNGIPVFSADGRSKSWRVFLAWARVWKELTTLRRQKKSFILLSWLLTDATFICSWYARFFRTKHFAIAAGQDVLKSNRYLRWISRKHSQIIVLNEKMNNHLLHSGRKSANHIIPIGTKFNFDLPSGPRRLDVLMIGSLTKGKQWNASLYILSEVKKEFPLLAAAIIGEGPERMHLENLKEELLPHNVVFTGELQRENVFLKMQQSKILLHTSVYEGQSTVISEALACGMSVICFDVGRITDHEKIHVCRNEEEMILVLIKLLRENKLSYDPVIPVTLHQSMDRYYKLLFE